IIGELQNEGLVYCIKGSGTFVSPPRASRLETAFDKTRKLHWAVIIPDASYGIHPKAFRGIESFTREHNVDFVVCCTYDDVDNEYEHIQREISVGVDGLIIVPAISTAESIRNYNYITRTGTPFVFWQRGVDYMLDVPQLLLNGYYGGYIATKHLLDKGYTRISYLAPKRFRSSMDRYMGYCAALSEAHIDVDPNLSQIGIPEGEGCALAKRMLTSDNAPDAFVCYVDSLAAEVVQAIQDVSLRISDDVGVIGFEGVLTWMDAMLQFGMTYVDINSFESGYTAAEALWALMTEQHPDIQTRVFMPTLCVRNTCLGKSSAVVSSECSASA
ncbi:MAG: substrate-binding domain-containing protein, partial [Clostridia bacterium]|nr:substrate-binding domain-containing protein [Clostridia bacterium]